MIFIILWIYRLLNILEIVFALLFFLILFWLLFFQVFFFLNNHFLNILCISLLILNCQSFRFSLFILLLYITLIGILDRFNFFFLTLWLIWIGFWVFNLIITKNIFSILFILITLIYSCNVQSYLFILFINRIILVMILGSHIKRLHLVNLFRILELVAIIYNVILLIIVGRTKPVLISALSQSGIKTQILFQIVNLIRFLDLLEIHYKIFKFKPVIF